MALHEDSQKHLMDLKKKRAVIKASLTRVRTFVSKFDLSIQAVSLLEFRQEELPQINRKFDDVQSQIELLTVDDMEEAELEREKFENDYFEIRSQIQELINQEKAHSSAVNNSSFLNHSLHRAQLAPIPLPKFNGNIEEWASFYDIFRAMVHNDDSYSAAQKFFYLRSCLEGPALDLIRSIPVSDGNYEVVTSRLIHQYDNQSLVIQSHIRAILESPYVDESSPNTLQKLYSNTCTHISALKALNQPVEHWDAWLITIITSRLDKGTAHGWQLHQRNTELPKYADLEAFLASRCAAIEATTTHMQVAGESYSSNTSKHSKKSGTFSNVKKSLIVAANTGIEKCYCCSGAHKLYACSKFRDLPVGERITVVRQAKLCFNCLYPFHMAEKCKSKYSCQICKLKHNTLLHFEKTQSTTSETKEPNRQTDSTTQTLDESKTKASLSVLQSKGHVFLAIASVLVKDNHGHSRKCRAILDSGSQVNIISGELFRQLQLRSNKSVLPITGIGSNNVYSAASVEVHVESRLSNFGLKLSCHILPTIVSQLPAVSTPVEGWRISSELIRELADPDFYKSGSIDLLIGAGVFFDVLESKRIPLEVNSLFLQSSKFGLMDTGEMETKCLIGVNRSPEENWEVTLQGQNALYGRSSKANQRCMEEQQALKHYQHTVKRDQTGRFVLRLPLKAEVDQIGETLSMATNRFYNVEKRLQRDDELRISYTNFMEEYLRMGHMEEVKENSLSNKAVFYLPHHPILKSSSLTTKLRVVFDASVKSSSGLALNDVLMCGPTLQADVFTILCRFRRHLFVITADVEKMYRQIKVAREDCDLQRILWRTSPSEELRKYRLLRLTYGMTPASFMATQCLAELAKDNEIQFPVASKAVENDFYMDDLMTGSDSEEGCLLLQQQLSAILDSAGMPLRKWCSNSAFVREKIGKTNEDPLFALEIDNDDSIKSLGLCWRPIMDEFRFSNFTSVKGTKLTKRVLLSDLNRVFDPLGFLAPILIRGKIFIQKIWQIKMDWDSPLSEDLQSKWREFQDELEDVRLISIPRGTFSSNRVPIEIHGFCDASEEAYGACVYVRSQDQYGEWHSRLLCAKSRVASLKGETIPRLELNGALVLAQLVHRIAISWELNCRSCRLWTDSTIVLGWLNAQSTRLKVYVANRINQILEVTDVWQWKYVNTVDNPADIISRGIKTAALRNTDFWWKGPKWLYGKESTWTAPDYNPIKESDLPEQRPMHWSLIVVGHTHKLFQHYSNWKRLLSAVGWLKRFLSYLKLRNEMQCPKYLTVNELREAEFSILKLIQAEAFPAELMALEKGEDVSRSSKIRNLCPFIKNGLLLVGGRLDYASIPEQQRHPCVLPAGHHITRLIFEDRHRQLLHCGPQSLLADIRRKFWPLKGRLMARSVTLKCVRCIKSRPRFLQPQMAPLPQARTQCSRPFTVSGVDFAGPILIRSGLRRVAHSKAWISIFVCFSTRAVHMEPVEDLTSNAFLAALRRFMSRRGQCAKVYSDNGTNFVGAQKELSTVINKSIPSLSREGIEWHFNPASAPHFGGLWESAVKSAKHHLTRTIGETKLTLGELTTLRCQIEACMNSRPITPLSSDPSDIEALTPAHFLVGGPITLPQEPDLSQEHPGGLRRWKYVQFLTQTFWKRWYAEYLPQCQIREKWTVNKRTLKKDDVVIIKEDCTPPTKWKLGLVTAIHPGKDGIVRVVTLRTSSGNEIRRPVVKLCRLPVESEENKLENTNFQRGEDVSAKT